MKTNNPVCPADIANVKISSVYTLRRIQTFDPFEERILVDQIGFVVGRERGGLEGSVLAHA